MAAIPAAAPEPARSFWFEVSCPMCGGAVVEVSTEAPTESLRRANVRCASCEATYRISVTLVRSWL